MNQTIRVNETNNGVDSLEDILDNVYYYSALFLFVPCFCLNLFTALIFLRPRFWHKTRMGFYYSLHSVLSAGTLAIFTVQTILNPVTYPLIGCQFILALVSFFHYTAICVQAFASVDLTLTTLYPKRMAFLARVDHLWTIVILIFIYIGGLSLINFWRTNNFETVSFNVSINTCVFIGPLHMAYTYITLLLHILAAVIMFTTSFILLHALLQSKRILLRPNASTRTSSSKLQAFTLSLAAADFLFVVFNLPYILVQVAVIANEQAQTPEVFRGTLNALLVFSTFVSILYEALPFVLTMTFNKVFRVELLILIWLVRVLRIKRKIHAI